MCWPQHSKDFIFLQTSFLIPSSKRKILILFKIFESPLSINLMKEENYFNFRLICDFAFLARWSQKADSHCRLSSLWSEANFRGVYCILENQLDCTHCWYHPRLKRCFGIMLCDDSFQEELFHLCWFALSSSFNSQMNFLLLPTDCFTLHLAWPLMRRCF